MNKIDDRQSLEEASEAPSQWGRRLAAGAAIAASLGFEAIARRYGETVALAQVDLTVAPGELVCLLGPSGCGKTTLLRIAAGIEKPTAGRVLIDGFEVAGRERFVPPDKRNVGMMFQDFALFPHLTIRENVTFGLWALPKEEARRVADAALDRVGLLHQSQRYPGALSGGEQQRVALARAIAPRPGVLLMDEPFSGLDVQLRQSMQAETLALLRETRATALMVTHDPEEAMRLADRIAIMRHGRIIQQGKAEQLYVAPADLFVARLFSDINELYGVVSGGAVTTPFGLVPTPGLADGERAVLVVRQGAVEVTTEGPGRQARVLDVKFLGDFAVAVLAVDGLDERLHARLREPERVHPGLDVKVAADPSRILVFRG